MARLLVEALRKQFGDDVVAVDDFDVEIDDGEFLVIVGPSGCGKSTTLNCIAGLEEPSAGEVVLGSETITDEPPQSRDIAMVFQSYALYPHMSVHDNLAFGLRMTTDLDAAAIDDRVLDVATLLEIEELLEKRPADLSGGQRQRVALGRAIVREPDLFLMDEPLSNLDAKLRTEMRTEISKLQDELAVTTIYVTHDQTEAMTMADRIAVMNGGVLQQVASPLDLYYRPANRFVAEFIGDPSMNVFEVAVTGSTDSTATLANEHLEIEIRDDDSTIASEDGALYLGVRPESFSFPEDSEPENAIEATVEVVEPMGNVTHVHFTVGDGEYTATVPGRRIPEERQNVRFAVPEEAVYVFDASGDTVRHPNVNVERQSVGDLH